jgi:membrane protein implicated in regulation of membrane protease activity
MEWWAWIAVGAILLVSELAFVDAQFYLVFVGAAALVVGFLNLAELLPAVWMQWLVFAVLAVFSMVAFRRRIYDRMRRKLPAMKQGPVGQSVVLPAELKPGETCRLEYCGSSWDAVNGGKTAIAAGERAHIDRVSGLTLVIHGEHL